MGEAADAYPDATRARAAENLSNGSLRTPRLLAVGRFRSKLSGPQPGRAFATGCGVGTGMRNLIIIAAAGAILAGCGKAPDWGAVKVQADGVRATCGSWYAREARLAVERCAAGSIRLLYVRAGLRDMDILDAYLAERQAIAERQDAGQITEVEANAEMAQARAVADSAAQTRGGEREAMATALAPALPPVTCSTYRAVTTCN